MVCLETIRFAGFRGGGVIFGLALPKTLRRGSPAAPPLTGKKLNPPIDKLSAANCGGFAGILFLSFWPQTMNLLV
jgi:hypothetical protein